MNLFTPDFFFSRVQFGSTFVKLLSVPDDHVIDQPELEIRVYNIVTCCQLPDQSLFFAAVSVLQSSKMSKFVIEEHSVDTLKENYNKVIFQKQMVVAQSEKRRMEPAKTGDG